MMLRVQIPDAMAALIERHAVEEYPDECCGMVLGKKNAPDSFTRVRRCRNVQDLYHQKDPENFPRTARTAYFIDPRELLAIDKELEKNGEEIRMIYHSHIDVGAYFSEEDVRRAMIDDEPLYPGVTYLVLSVIQSEVKDSKIFQWDDGARRFAEV